MMLDHERADDIAPSVEGVFLERIWPPTDAPRDWFCQIGGHPNLPPDFAWPHFMHADGGSTPLDFLAQIRLGDLPDVPGRELLPVGGALYFFARAWASEPLKDLGPRSWHVGYHSGDIAGLPAVEPPGLSFLVEDLGEGDTPASEFLDPDRPLEFFPRCPVRPIKAKSWKKPATHEAQEAWRALTDAWPGAAPPPTDFTYLPRDLPWRAADALLHLNSARNIWGEAVLPIDEFLYRSCAYGGTVPEEVRPAYDDWLARAKAQAGRLRVMDARPLDAAERQAVSTLVKESDRLMALVAPYYRRGFTPADQWASTALASLLLDEHGKQVPAEEVAASHPGRIGAKGYETHRMLGLPYPVQRGEGGAGRVMLLQLGSDWLGPRFQWWDMGNITFSIDRDALAKLDFASAVAEIEGY